MAVWYIPTSHSAPLSMWPFYELFQSSKMTSFLFSSGFFYLVDVYRMNKCFFPLHAFELFWKKSLRIRPPVTKNDDIKVPMSVRNLPSPFLRTYSTIFKVVVSPQISIRFYYVCYFMTPFHLYCTYAMYNGATIRYWVRRFQRSWKCDSFGWPFSLKK